MKSILLFLFYIIFGIILITQINTLGEAVYSGNLEYIKKSSYSLIIWIIIGFFWLPSSFQNMVLALLLNKISIFLIFIFASILLCLSLNKSTSPCITINTWGHSENIICNNKEITDGFNSGHIEYHCYDFAYKICEQIHPSCNVQLVYNTMLSNASFLAPTDSQVEVTNCTDLLLNTIPYWFNWSNRNPVTTTVEDNNKIINYTLPNHMFHPGKVIRQISSMDGSIWVRTTGEGTGRLKWINNNSLFMKYLIWRPVDKRLKKAVKKLL